ncbi:hypothetical protein F2Q69_00013351 [Brassica cretica]|uniref:Uncharacterized protein n=1 Tax=Brassica cretica TaxID=69181 RepID=A0A8S9R5Q6_BRACR|nr:hypothetical protein F2Q69_00013351 [Brassica cretica]
MFFRENEFLRFLNRKVPTVTPIEMKQAQVCSNPEWGSCEDGMKTARSFQLGHPPNWTGPARRMAELVECSIQLGHPPRWTGSARLMAELVVLSIQLGGWPSWSRVRSSSSIHRTGLVSSAIRRTRLVQLGG